MRFSLAAICWLVTLGCALPAEAAWRIALFDFELINTSLEATRPEENARLAMMSALLREEFAAREDFDFEVLDTSPLAQDIAEVGSLHGCNGCELQLAQRIDAEFAAIGWVQKVSKIMR